jgi:hypothetical protein
MFQFLRRWEFLFWCYELLYHVVWQMCSNRAVAQSVSRLLPTAAARFRALVRSCGICDGQSSPGAGFLRVLRFPPIALHWTSPIIIRGWYNRPVVSSVIVDSVALRPSGGEKLVETACSSQRLVHAYRTARDVTQWVVLYPIAQPNSIKWARSIASDLYSVGARIESKPGHRLSDSSSWFSLHPRHKNVWIVT